MSTTTTVTFDFTGAFESLVDQAGYRRPGSKKRVSSFPEIHEVCLDKFAVVEYADRDGQTARVNRMFDSIDALSRTYGWSVDAIIRTLDRYTKSV